MNGSLAQLEEHLVYTERVGSSNLSTPTNKNTANTAVFLYSIKNPSENNQSVKEWWIQRGEFLSVLLYHKIGN